MNKISIYVAYSSNNKDNFTHGLKIPRDNALSLCNINPKTNNSSWVGNSSDKITCPKCLETIRAINKKMEFISLDSDSKGI